MENAIAAACSLAESGAFIGIDIVAIVALLDAPPDDAITTGRWPARVGALIAVEFVAVVALFPLLFFPVTAHGDIRLFVLAAQCEKRQA